MKNKILSVISVWLIALHVLNAQVVLQKQTARDGIVTSLRFRTDTVPVTMSKAKEVLNSINKMQAADEWRLEKSSVDKQGTKHQYYLQYHKGIRVAYGTYSMHGNGREQLESAIGNFQKIDQVNTTARLSESEALQHAMKHIGAELYKWQIPEEEHWIKEYLNDTYYPQGEMVIVKDILQGSNQYRLAYKFDIYAHKPLSRYMVYVDAIDGRILDKDSRIHHTNTHGTAVTRYSGTRNIITDSFSGGFRLRELRNGVRIETYNMNNTGTYSQTDFVDNDNNWIEHNNANRDNAALDAHWGAEITYDYFRQVHGRNSYNNSGAPLLSYVNANLVALGYPNNDNAFWDGSRITYGRGTNFDPFTTLDICAHEIAHGVTGNTARLVYRKESGAINEALSDIWAACVEARSAPEKQRWLMGEDIGAMRSMSNPNQFNHPDTYLGTNWINTNNCTPTSGNDYCGVHRNSGVINHWFFLLSEGGTGTNDIGNSFWVGAIGMDNAARIVYRTQSVILQSSVEQEISIAQFREATITAASNIFGNNSNEVAQVTNAWHAVGVGNRYQYRISGPSVVCDQATYTVENLPPGATVQWSASNNSMTLQSGQGTATAVFRQTGITNGEIRAAINFNGTVIANLAQPVTICQPSLSGPSVVCDQATYTVENLPPGATVQWSAGNSLTLVSQQGNTATFTRNGTSSGVNALHANIVINNTIIPINRQIWIGKPSQIKTIGGFSRLIKAGGKKVFYIDIPQEQDVNYYEWEFVGGYIISGNGTNRITVEIPNVISKDPYINGENEYYVTVTYGNSCGNYTVTNTGIILSKTKPAFSLSPNPATDVVTVQLSEAAGGPERAQTAGRIALSGVCEIQLWSATTMLRSYKTDRPVFEIPVSELPAGIYFVRVIKDGKAHTEKLLKR